MKEICVLICVNHISSYRSYKTRKSVLFGCNIKPSNQSISRVFVFDIRDIRVLNLIQVTIILRFSSTRIFGRVNRFFTIRIWMIQNHNAYI